MLRLLLLLSGGNFYSFYFMYLTVLVTLLMQIITKYKTLQLHIKYLLEHVLSTLR